MNPQALGSPEQLMGAASAVGGVLTAVISAAAILLGAALLVWGRKLLRGVLALTGLFTGVIIGMVVLPLIAGASLGGLSTVIVGGVLGAFAGIAAGLLLHRIGTALVSGLTCASIALTVWSLIAFPAASVAPMDANQVQFAGDLPASGDMSNVPFATVASAEGGFGYFPDTQLEIAKDVLADARASGAPLPESAIPDVLKTAQPTQVQTPVPTKAAPSKQGTAPVVQPAASLPAKGLASKLTADAITRPVLEEVTTRNGLAATRTKASNGKTRISIGKAQAGQTNAKKELEPLANELPLDAASAIEQLKDLPLLSSPAASEVMDFASAGQFQAMGPLTGLSGGGGNVNPLSMMPQIPLGKIVAGLIIAALAGVAGFAGALMRHKQAACIVTSVIGASWLVVGVSGTVSVVPELSTFAADLPSVVWIVLLVILAAVGATFQLKSLKPVAAPQPAQSLAKSMRSLADPSAMEEGGKSLE
jgi:hypothetical protein